MGTKISVHSGSNLDKCQNITGPQMSGKYVRNDCTSFFSQIQLKMRILVRDICFSELNNKP